MQSSNSSLAQTAYGNANAVVRTERSIEYQVFARATNMLATAQTQAGNMPVLAEALDYNRQVWSALSKDVGSDDNKLPLELRAQIMSLAIFVRNHSQAVLKGTHSLEALIDINTTIMRGLREETKG